MRWLAMLGDMGYTFLLWLNKWYNLMRALRGKTHSLKELKDAGLIQGEVETPKVKYCINRDNWMLANRLFDEFFGQCACKKGGCCD